MTHSFVFRRQSSAFFSGKRYQNKKRNSLNTKQKSLLPHPELHRRKPRLADKELPEDRLVGESQFVGYLLDVKVGTLQQFPGVGTQQLRDVETDRMPGNLLDDARQIGSRYVQPVGIEADVVLLAVVMHQQTLEVSEYLARTFHAGCLFPVLPIQRIGHLQQHKAA